MSNVFLSAVFSKIFHFVDDIIVETMNIYNEMEISAFNFYWDVFCGFGKGMETLK